MLAASPGAIVRGPACFILTASPEVLRMSAIRPSNSKTLEDHPEPIAGSQTSGLSRRMAQSDNLARVVGLHMVGASDRVRRYRHNHRWRSDPLCFVMLGRVLMPAPSIPDHRC